MTTREKILRKAKKEGLVRTADLTREFKLSRQTLSRYLSDLVAEGRLLKTGSTRNAVYAVSSKKKSSFSHQAPKTLNLVKKISGLEEHLVYEEIESKMPLKSSLSSKAQTIFQYALTEMLNNAIEHSRSEKVSIFVRMTNREITFQVKDSGIGVFFNVQKNFNLKNELEGMEHVFKGKQTTFPERHTGEGIFFTSRISDVFELKSHRLSVTINNHLKDTSAKEEKFEKGTKVVFKLNNKSRKSLKSLFDSYTNKDYIFDKNQIRVVLSKAAGNLSRSQAKRLLFGLEKFKEIIFDFKGIKEIGQGFADEIFRVFPLSHSDVSIAYDHAIPVVEFMIKRALSSKS